MDHIPSISPKRFIRILERVGFVVIRQNGSHVRLKFMERNLRVSVPLHNKDFSRGLLKTILKQAQISEDEFKKML